MKKKILFALKDMNIGGVEKSLLSLLSEIDQSQYDVTVFLLRDYGGFLDLLPEWVNVKILEGYEKVEGIVNNPPLVEIRKLVQQGKKILGFKLLTAYLGAKLTGSYMNYYKNAFSLIDELDEHYDIAISYTSIISYLTYFVDYKVNAKEKIGWIHFDVNKLNIDKKTTYQLHKGLNKIFVVSQEAYDNFIQMFPALCGKCEVRYNIVSRKYIEELADEKIEDMNYSGIKIVTLGRLAKEKGQDMIPNIALKLKEADIKFRWYLIGEGSLRKELDELIVEQGLENEIVLLGARENPYPYLKKADVYVQTSRYEGYCISLAEARMLNLPIVTTDFAGAREQIENQKTGSIVEVEENKLFGAVIELVMSPEKRKYYSENLRLDNRGKEYEN